MGFLRADTISLWILSHLDQSIRYLINMYELTGTERGNRKEKGERGKENQENEGRKKIRGRKGRRSQGEESKEIRREEPNTLQMMA